MIRNAAIVNLSLSLEQVKLLTGREGILATRIDRFAAWDIEAVYTNPSRLLLSKCPANLGDGIDPRRARMGDYMYPNKWKTTRFVTRRVTVNADVQLKASQARKQDLELPTGSTYSTRTQLGRDMTGWSARHKLFDYSKKRFVAHLAKGGSVGQDVLDDYISLINLGPPFKRPKAWHHCDDIEKMFLKPSSHSSDQESSPPNERLNARTMECTSAIDPSARNGVFPKVAKLERMSPSSEGAKWNGANVKLVEGVIDERMAFPSVKAGIHRGILYQSVVQSRLTLEGFEADEDSDGDNIVVDEHWRLELNDRTLSEYLDTSAPEKVYMNLWNRFSMCEFFVYSDRRLLKAVSSFARRYGAVLDALRLEVVFLRHLTELSRLGLLDASGIHETIIEFGKAKAAVAAGTENIEERLSNFEFLSRVLSEGDDSKYPHEETPDEFRSGGEDLS
jgi:hypothetical protein